MTQAHLIHVQRGKDVHWFVVGQAQRMRWVMDVLYAVLCSSISNTLAGPLGRASVSCHTCWSLVWSCSRCNSIKNTIVGMYSTVSVLKLTLDI